MEGRSALGRPSRWIWALGPVVLYAAAIVALSSRTRLPEPGLLEAIMRLFAKSPFAAWFGFDKIEHFCEYALLGFLVARALRVLGLVGRGALALVMATTLAGAAFGATDELHQFFVPGRDSSIFDLLADTLGSATGATAWVLLSAAVRRLYPAPLGGPAVREGG